jgi:hypothetical protein
MTERGFVLVAVLWTMTIIAAAAGAAVAAERLGQRATSNRIRLARGHWAAEACLAVAHARWTEHRRPLVDSVDLGRTTWCSWRVDDPTARVNVNTADPDLLARLIPDSNRVAWIVDRRRTHPFFDVRESALRTGSDDGVTTYLTVDGPGTINVSAASLPVLLALPGLPPEAADRLAAAQEVGESYASLEALASTLSPTARTDLLQAYPRLAGLVTFVAPQLIITSSGWVDSPSPHATIEETVVPQGDRLAVIRRRLE